MTMAFFLLMLHIAVAHKNVPVITWPHHECFTSEMKKFTLPSLQKLHQAQCPEEIITEIVNTKEVITAHFQEGGSPFILRASMVGNSLKRWFVFQTIFISCFAPSCIFWQVRLQIPQRTLVDILWLSSLHLITLMTGHEISPCLSYFLGNNLCKVCVLLRFEIPNANDRPRNVHIPSKASAVRGYWKQT